MATKHKHRSKRDAVGLFQQAERSLEKGDFKDALKDAKVWHRQQNSQESRRLLERAALARGRQLYRAGLHEEARAVFESLLDSPVTDVSVCGELPELLIALGLANRLGVIGGGVASLAEDSPLRAKMADHAVLCPEKAPASEPAICQGARIVRRALAAVEAGDEAQAVALLKEVARESPFADWKFLVRGLAAYYRQDTVEMQANWSRLDGGRLAARIAAPLIALAEPGSGPPADSHTADALARLGDEVFGDATFTRLRLLQDHLSARRWQEAAKLYRLLAASLREVDPALPQRLTAILVAAFVRKGAVAAVKKLAATAEPPVFDPRWNRSLAMAWECCGEGDPSEAEGCWRAYAEDLAGMACLLPGERVVGQALVWQRLGRMLVQGSGALCTSCGVRHSLDEEIQGRAVECFQTSLNLAPEVLSTHQALAEAYGEWEEAKKAVAAYERLLAHFPENFDALMFLASRFLKQDEPQAARDYVFRAERLKPLDPQVKALVWAVHVACARHHALAGRWDEGRAEFAAAEKVGNPTAGPHQLLVRQAALEFKAGQGDSAQRFLDGARKQLGEAAPVGLLMAIEGVRYALPKALADDLERKWQAALKKCRSGMAAGEMSQILLAHVVAGVRYGGWRKHVGRFLDFLGRRSRIKWQSEDLCRLLKFLVFWEHYEEEEEAQGRSSSRSTSDQAGDLLEHYTDKARKSFPEVAFFQFMAGELEMRLGPWDSDRQFARECFERAVQLGQTSSGPFGAETARQARERLDVLDQFERVESAPGFSPDGPFGGADEDDTDGADEGYSGPFFDDGEPVGFDPQEILNAESPAKLFGMFAKMCRAMGMDPEEILDRAATTGPFRFRADRDSPRARKK